MSNRPMRIVLLGKKAMEVRSTCPICGQADVSSLPEHLESHTKQSLIEMLLAQHHQIRRQQPPWPSTFCVVSSASARVEGTSEPNSETTATTAPENNEEASRTEASQVVFESQHSGEEERRGVRDAKNKSPLVSPPANREQPAQPRAAFGLGGSTSQQAQQQSPPSISSQNEPGPSSKQPSFTFRARVDSATPNTTVVFSPPKSNLNPSRPAFIYVDPTPLLTAGTSKGKSVEDVTLRNMKLDRGADADTTEMNPNSSIIQYIIDESGQITDAPQEEPDSWILADGRTIPVYSSLHQVSESTPSCTMTVDISGNNSKRSESGSVLANQEKNTTQSQMHLDLMTDEEIPPRGEISEYEETESNASSILSEDSNLRQGRGMFSDLRRSPSIVNHEQNIFFNRKKRSPPKPIAPQQQYTCHECPQPQVFSSLFELAEHKFESHQGKSMASTTTVTITPTEDILVPDDLHILPEKIRRQSQTDELIDPLGDGVIPSELVPSTSAGLSIKKEYFCVYCDFTSKKRSSLAEHMKSNHEGKPTVPSMFECTYCGKVFNARTNLRKHLLIHKEKKYSCPTCRKGFTSNFKLIEHMRVHTKTYPFKCNGCEKTYRTPSLLNYHVKMVHLPESERPPKRKLEFYCSQCHRVLHSKRSYVNHMQLHQEKPMKCSFCSETFTRHSVMVRHIRVVHDPQYESKESKDCPICHKKLHPNSMIKHMRIHSNEKPYSCNVCNKFFRTHANLTSHSWSHTNQEKPHKCRLCSKSYLFKKNLENHMMVHKKRTMHFVCNECGVKFTHKVNMKRHLEEHYKEKQHVCKTCGKAFQRNYYLIEHERIHSGLKPFICNICGKSSTTKSNHRAHLKIHDARETGNQEG